MEGHFHNCDGSMWNSCNEHLLSSPLDLQNYNCLSNTRERHYAQHMNKTPVSISTHSPYMLLNYSQDISHQHVTHHQCQLSGREQWHVGEWQTMKAKTNSGPLFSISKQSLSKSSLTQHQSVIPLQATEIAGDHIPVQNPSGFFSPSYSQSLDDFVRGNQDLHQHQQQHNNAYDLNFSSSSYTDNTNNSKTVSRRIKRKNPAPKKRKEIQKNDIGEKKKRIRNEEAWSRNRRKNARAKGESYVSVVGKTIPARSVKPVDCSKCRFDCASHISEEYRQSLFKTYWGLDTFREKVDFICNCVQEFVPLRPVSGKRAFSRRYKLKVNDKEERVCKEFFTTTFDISESTIVTCMNKKRENPEIIQDLRGKRAPSNKTPENILRNIREHILSEIGYQGNLDKPYMDESKNVKKLYELYQAECSQEKQKPVSISIYRKVFTDLHKCKPIILPPCTIDILSHGTKLSSNSFKSTSSAFPSTCNEQSPPSSASECEISCDPDAKSDFHSLSISVAQNFPSHQVITPTDAFQNEVSGSEMSTSGFKLPASTRKLHHPPQLLSESQIEIEGTSTTFHQSSFHNKDIDLIDSKQSKPFKKKLQISPPSNNHEKNVGSCIRRNYQSVTKKCISLPDTFREHSSFSSNYSSSQFAYPETSHAIANIPNILPLGICPSDQNTMSGTSKSSQIGPKNIYVPQECKGSHSNRRKTDGGEKSMSECQRSEVSTVGTKRTRNEESWARNVRKRSRFKGEEYTSVTGKKVEAKKVLSVDCSKCRFKCLSKMTEEQREEVHAMYWSLESYEEKVYFITKHVPTYKPKRRQTGRRSFSRKYVFEVDRKEVQVCKDFFQATLNISESTISTALDKSRKGPESIVDLRGKHRPSNKTPDETLQNISELIIYVTGLRPRRIHQNQSCGQNVVHLYQAYKYDCQVKGNKPASLGVFRCVLLKEFGIFGNSKISKAKTKKNDNLTGQSSQQASIISV